MPDLLPLHLKATDGEVFDVGPFHIISRLVGAQTEGAFEYYHLTLAVGGVVDYHVHYKADEVITVLEGEIEFKAAGHIYQLGAGGVAFAPKGVHHGFSNTGTTPVKVYITFTPAESQNDYFRKLAALVNAGNPDPATVKALQSEYDQNLVPFP